MDVVVFIFIINDRTIKIYNYNTASIPCIRGLTTLSANYIESRL